MNNIQNISIINGGNYTITGLSSQASIYAKNYGYFYIKNIKCNKYTSGLNKNSFDVFKIRMSNGYYDFSFYSDGNIENNTIKINEPINKYINIDTSTMSSTGTTFCTIEYSRGPFLDFYYNYGLEILFFIIVCISFILGFIKGKLNF